MGLFDIFGIGSDQAAGFQARGVGLEGAGYDQAIANRQGKAHVMDAFTQQQNFLNALQAQGGVGNQAHVFNQQQALFGQQQAFANQLQEQANGGGPNPALAQLAMTTGQNMQGQAALMANQRGGANPALMSRMAAQQGGNMQQQASGQAAVMRAQQQLASQQALQQQQGMMGQTQANMGNLASQQVGQQANALGTYQQGTLGNLNMQLGNTANANAQRVGMQSNVNNANAGIASQNAANQTKIVGGILNGAAGAAGTAFAAHGGVIPPRQSLLSQHCNGYAGGGMIEPVASGDNALMNVPLYHAQVFDNSALFTPPNVNKAGDKATESKGDFKGPEVGTGAPSDTYMFLAGGGVVPKDAHGNHLDCKRCGYAHPNCKCYSSGGKVDGKPKVKGDSSANDTVPAMLSPGEVVIPRTMVNDPAKIAAFLNSLLGIHLVAQGAQ